MTRTRARADERNEKTDSVTRERRRIRELEAEVQELREWKDEREQRDEDTEAERERLADLMNRLAENMETASWTLAWDEGVNAREALPGDFYRIAELLDPDED